MKQKAVLISGAGSGIGAATALEFSKNGYFVYLLGRDKEKLQNTAVHCKQGASIIGCDLKNLEAVNKKIQEVLSVQVHEIQILINNAGTFTRHSVAEASDELWMEQFQSNLMSAVRLTRWFVPRFIEQGGGSIVNVSSTLGLKTAPTTGAYSAMKAAMINWTHTLALELAKNNIRANCICPGIVDTPIHDFHQLPGGEKAKAIESMKNLQPLGRIGTPEDIARSIYFLASPQSAWTTGAVLSVDGGINLT